MTLKISCSGKIYEGRDGTLYHYTSFSNALSIVQSNIMRIGRTGYLSFTRNRHLNRKPIVGFSGGVDVRISFDERTLTYNYKIDPYSYHGLDVKVGDESEERIFKNINNIKRYITGIAVFENRFPSQQDRDYHKKLTLMNRILGKKLDQYGVPKISFSDIVDFFTSYGHNVLIF